MTPNEVVAAMAAAAEAPTEAEVNEVATRDMWAKFVRMLALDSLPELTAATVEFDLASRHWEPQTALLALHLTIAKIHRASRDYRQLRELDDAMRDLAIEMAGGLPPKPPPS